MPSAVLFANLATATVYHIFPCSAATRQSSCKIAIKHIKHKTARGSCGTRAGMVYYSAMQEQSNKFNNPRAGAIGAVLLYLILGCALVALFCWRVATTSRQEATAPTAAPQTEPQTES